MNVLMPQLGETVTEGKVATWFKIGGRRRRGRRKPVRDRDRQGDDGGAGDLTGVLAEIRVPAGATVPVGTIVAVLGGKARSGGAEIQRRGGRGQGAARARAGTVP